MARKVRFRVRSRKNSMEEAFWLTLRQKRYDSDGNKIPGFTFDEIYAKTLEEREKVRQAGWLATPKLTVQFKPARLELPQTQRGK